MPNGVWTNNWAGIKNAMLLSERRSGYSTIKTTSGTVLSGQGISYSSPVYSFENRNNPYNNCNAIVFGSSTTAPDVTDYKLGTKWESGISRISLTNSSSYDASTHTKTRIVVCTIQNTDASPYTIREWGIESYANGDYVLLYRALLDTPVTLQQYESATFTCRISMRLTDPA